jgi:foldase protein PrsA
MLEFMRKYASHIIIGTLAIFVLSIGVIGFSKPARYAKQRSGIKAQGVLASINGKEIDQTYFTRLYNGGINGYRDPGQRDPLDPKVEAYIRYSSVVQTMEFQKYFDTAKKLHIKVSRGEVDQQIEAMIKTYGLKSKQDLKNALAANGYKYNDFLRDIRNEMVVNKLMLLTKQRVVVTDQDVKDQFKRVKARHILVAVPQTTDPAQHAQQVKAAREKIALAYDKLMKKADFAKVATGFSDDPGSATKGGELGWFGAGMMVPEFERVAFALKKDQISKPFETAYGFHIVQVTDIEQKEIPLDVDEKELQKKLTETRQQQAIQELRQSIATQYQEEIFAPVIKAYQNKVNGELDKAMLAYRQLSAQNPQNPIPFLFTAELYEMKKDYPMAESEYKKALLIEKLNPQTRTPFIHFYLGKMYAKQKRIAAAVKELQAAEAAVKDDSRMLTRIKDSYDELGYKALGAKTAVKIKALENARNAAMQKARAAQGTANTNDDLDFETATKNVKKK